MDDYIQAQRPVTADVTVSAPAASALNIVINNVDAIHAAGHGRNRRRSLADLIRRESEPGGTLLVSHIREAIFDIAGRDGSRTDIADRQRDRARHANHDAGHG